MASMVSGVASAKAGSSVRPIGLQEFEQHELHVVNRGGIVRHGDRPG
jgi:hypothetical protein